MSATVIERETPRTQRSLLSAVKAVAWSFVGLRRGSDHQQEMARISPVHVIAVGLAGAIVFVLALILFVHWVAG